MPQPTIVANQCRYCHRSVRGYLAYCETCWQIVSACRATLHELVRDHFLEQVAPGAWLIKPGAQAIVQLVWDVIEQYLPESRSVELSVRGPVMPAFVTSGAEAIQ